MSSSKSTSVSREVGLLLKSVGFSEPCLDFYIDKCPEGMLNSLRRYDDYDRPFYTDKSIDDHIQDWNIKVEGRDERISAPSVIEAIIFLQEEYDIFLSILTTSQPCDYGSSDPGDLDYLPYHSYKAIKNIDNFKYDKIESSSYYENYIECYNVGLQDCLLNLI